MKSRVLELNASHERGIDVIRHRVKEFAQLSVSNNPNSELQSSTLQHIMKDSEIRTFPCPPFKLIILDEADNLTKDAQMALRRIMETYAKVTRFCLICNYVSRMIDPIVSRCAKFRFTSLPREIMKQRLELICQKENIRLPLNNSDILNHNDDHEMDITEDSGFPNDISVLPSRSPLDTLCDISQGDLRQAITLLQSASKLLSPTSTLTASVIEELACVVPSSFISELHNIIKKNNFSASHQLARRCMKEGYGGEVVLHSWLKLIVSDSSISEIKKAKMLGTLGELEKCLVDGANEYLQILYCIGQLTQILHGNE
jgi:replication factor C subunit 2/4